MFSDLTVDGSTGFALPGDFSTAVTLVLALTADRVGLAPPVQGGPVRDRVALQHGAQPRLYVRLADRVDDQHPFNWLQERVPTYLQGGRQSRTLRVSKPLGTEIGFELIARAAQPSDNAWTGLRGTPVKIQVGNLRISWIVRTL